MMKLTMLLFLLPLSFGQQKPSTLGTRKLDVSGCSSIEIHNPSNFEVRMYKYDWETTISYISITNPRIVICLER